MAIPTDARDQEITTVPSIGPEFLSRASPGGEPNVVPTIVGMFWDNVDRSPNRVALRFRSDADWYALTWRQYGDEVASVVEGLRGLGVHRGDRVAIIERHHKRFDLEALAQDPDVHAAVDEAIQRVNAEVARVEGIKRFRILPAPFAAATGELTPTLKVKRNVVIAKYSALVDEMYADEG